MHLEVSMRGREIDPDGGSEPPMRTGNVRILTSQEELAEAVARAQEFERQSLELLATRAQCHREGSTKSLGPCSGAERKS